MIEKKRVVFVDQVRALAITMMLVGHSMDRFLGDTWKATEAYRNYQFVRGLSSSLFLTVAGFSFVIASFGRMEAYTSMSDRMKARLRRIGFILFLGMVLQMPSATLYGMMQVTSPARWEYFYSFNVLQNIGLGLLMLHGLLFSCRDARRFAITAGIGAVVIFAAASLTYRPSFDAVLPVFLKGAFNLYHKSRFPMVPLTAFMFVGALLGALYWLNRETPQERWVVAGGALFGIVLVIFEQVIRSGMIGEIFPYGSRLPHTPGNTFARLGCALLIISAFYFLNQFKTVLAGPALTMSRESLTIYFVHLLIVYGSALMPGVLRSMKHQMMPWQVGLFAVSLWVAMYAMAGALGYLRRTYPKRLTEWRRGILLAAGLMFLFLRYRSFWGTLLVLVAAFAMVYRRFIFEWALSSGRVVRRRLGKSKI